MAEGQGPRKPGRPEPEAIELPEEEGGIEIERLHHNPLGSRTAPSPARAPAPPPPKPKRGLVKGQVFIDRIDSTEQAPARPADFAREERQKPVDDLLEFEGGGEDDVELDGAPPTHRAGHSLAGLDLGGAPILSGPAEDDDLVEQAEDGLELAAPEPSAALQPPARGGEHFGIPELDSAAVDVETVAAPSHHGVEELDGSTLEQETTAPPPPTPASEENMQAAMEITDFLAGFDAGAGFASTGEEKWSGLPLQVRELLAPVEELLHGRTGAPGGITLAHRGVDEICAAFAMRLVLLAAERKVIPLMVKSSALLCEGRPVLREAGPSGSGLYRLYAAGVQTLTVVEGIDRAQAETLARVLTQPPGASRSAAEAEGDVARWFWEAGLTHVRLSLLETFEEVEPLPDTGLPVVAVLDQAVEQMVRLKSRLLAAVPGVSGGRERVTAVRNLTISQEDLRALDRGLFKLGADLLSRVVARRSVLPFPELPARGAELRQAVEQDSTALDAREMEELLQTLLLLQEPDRVSPILDRLVARPVAFFAAGEVEKGVHFLKGLGAWSEREPQRREKMEAVEAIGLRASRPRALVPLLERYPSLTPARRDQVKELLNLLPAPATATLGLVVGKPNAAGPLVVYFKERLAEDLVELTRGLAELSPEQSAGLCDGAVAVGSPSAAQLALLLGVHDAAEARTSAARACARLPLEAARTIVEHLASDEEPLVRQAVVKAVAATGNAELGALLLKATAGARFHEWTFPEKRAVMNVVAQTMKAAAHEPLVKLASKQNPYRRRSLSETRASALLALALIKEPGDEKLAVALSRETERRVLSEAAKSLHQVTKGPPEEQGKLLERLEAAFRKYDTDEDDAAESKDQDVVHELSPQAIKAMKIDDLLARPGEPLQNLGAGLVRALAKMMLLAREGKVATDPFTVAVGRAANLAAALSQRLEGPVALQSFDDHLFVNGARLRLPFEVFSELGPLLEVFKVLHINEVLFAEPPSRSDLLEVTYSILTALKQEREPWSVLERLFARVRLRELILIRESWGRQQDVAVDVRANAARLFGTLYLWFEDVARLADDHDLLPLRAERLVRELTDAVEEGDALLEGLLGEKPNGGDAGLLLCHATLLSAGLARWLGLRRDQIASVVRCAMLRGVGHLVLPRPLLEDLGAESPTEAGELMRVPLYGVARVAAAENHGQRLQLAMVTAFEALAPITAVGSRAQKQLRAQAPLTHSRILEVAMRYAFLTSSFPRRPALGADDAVARMLGDPELDHRLVQAFANCAAVIPAGARVRLSDGREALVISAPLQISRADPMVLKITVNADGEPAGDLLRGAPVVTICGDEEVIPEITGVIEAPTRIGGMAELAALIL